jgi:hypothetical protein
MKIRRVGAELFDPVGWTDGETDMTKLIVGFRNFANALNPLNAELNPICHLLALLGGATVVVVSRLRINKCNKNSNINTRVEQYMDGTEG